MLASKSKFIDNSTTSLIILKKLKVKEQTLQPTGSLMYPIGHPFGLAHF